MIRSSATLQLALLSAFPLASQGNERVKEHFAGVCLGKAERFELLNLGALNFLVYYTLDGGGTLPLRMEIDVEDTQ